MSSVDDIRIGEAIALSELSRPTMPTPKQAADNTNIGGPNTGDPYKGPDRYPTASDPRIKPPAWSPNTERPQGV